MEYIHYNSVATGLCNLPEEYKYSSAKFYETAVDEFNMLTHWMRVNTDVGDARLQKPSAQHTTSAASFRFVSVFNN